MSTDGIPGTSGYLHKIISLYSDSKNPDRLLAGTEEGLLESKDGGKSWSMLDDTRIVMSIETVIRYVITEKERGAMISQDGGLNWKNIGLYLGKDAVAYFSVNPTNRNEIAAVTFESSVYMTQDGGNSWSILIEKGSLK